MRLRTNLKALSLLALAGAAAVWGLSSESSFAQLLGHRTTITTSTAHKTASVRLLPAKPTPPPPPVDTGAANAFKNLIVKNLGRIVNGDVNDFGPTITADGRTMFFVSERPGTGLEDFWMTTSPENNDTTWSAPSEVKEINSTYADGAASIAADGQTIFFASNRNSKSPENVDIWVATLDGIHWKNVREIGAPINTVDWESQPSISPDGKRLYFASNRANGPDGKVGNVDIYVSHQLPDGRWGTPVNLGGKINTDEVDFYPFIAADGQTLYFSSGKPGGGLDLYMSTWTGPSDADWSPKVRLPEPINSNGDDISLTVPAAANVLFFASDRSGGSGKFDLYLATNPPKPKPTLVLRGTCYDVNTNEKLAAHVIIVDEATGDTVYNKFANSATGEYLAILPSNAKGQLGGGYLISATESNHFPYPPTREMIPLRDDTSRIVTHDIPMNNEKPPLVHWVTQTPQLLNEKPNLFGANFKGVVIREQQTIELFTLLPMVFFDLGNGSIPNRYVLYTDPAQTNGFSEDTLSSTLNSYYNYLNILGQRLRNNPNTSITLTGTNSQDVEQEKSVDLSRQRAEAVKKYLVEIWGIEPNRLKLEARKLPENPTLPTTPEGIEENRRVEVGSDSWEIVHPVKFQQVVKKPDMPTAGFTFENGLRDNVIAKRDLVISYQGKPWKTISDLGAVNTTTYSGFNWRNEPGNKLPEGEDNMSVQLRITDTKGREVLSNVDEIAVRQFSQADVHAEHLTDKTRETYNLILFKYNSSDMGKWNHKIMESYVYSRIQPNSDVSVNGYTDILGTSDYNVKLSTNRANAVKSDIANHIHGKVGSLVAHGYGKEGRADESGQIKPLYTNELPEGRYYNRTVQVLVETPIAPNP